jgi:hypothetical protein
MPSRQRLDAGDAAGANFDLRLVIELNLVAFDRAPQIAGKRHPLDDRDVKRFGMKVKLIAAGCLGAIERDIGLLKHVLRTLDVRSEKRDADAGGDVDLRADVIGRTGQVAQNADCE